MGLLYQSYQLRSALSEIVSLVERSREIDWKKKIDPPCIEPVSRQNKLESGLLSALFACANKATERE